MTHLFARKMWHLFFFSSIQKQLLSFTCIWQVHCPTLALPDLTSTLPHQPQTACLAVTILNLGSLWSVIRQSCTATAGCQCGTSPVYRHYPIAVYMLMWLYKYHVTGVQSSFPAGPFPSTQRSVLFKDGPNALYLAFKSVFPLRLGSLCFYYQFLLASCSYWVLQKAWLGEAALMWKTSVSEFRTKALYIFISLQVFPRASKYREVKEPMSCGLTLFTWQIR